MGSAAMTHAGAILRFGSAANVTDAVAISINKCTGTSSTRVIADAVTVGIVAGLSFDPLLFSQAITGSSAIANTIG